MKPRIKVNTQLLVEYMRAHSLNKMDFCRQCSIPLSTLNTLLRGSSHVNAYYVIKIRNHTDIDLDELFSILEEKL